MPDENYVPGLDSKEYVQELNWVRELGEMIGVQPVIDDAGVDTDLLARAEQRGHELWAQDLLEDLEIETVQGNVQLEELLNALTFEATTELLGTLELSGDRVHKDNWQTAMGNLREEEALSIEGLQRVWWLFPLYRERPTELVELLEATRDALQPEENDEPVQSEIEQDANRTQTTESTRAGASESEPTEETVNQAAETQSNNSDQPPANSSEPSESTEDDSGIVGRIRDSIFGS
jgi:hypothetical protein